MIITVTLLGALATGVSFDSSTSAPGFDRRKLGDGSARTWLAQSPSFNQGPGFGGQGFGGQQSFGGGGYGGQGFVARGFTGQGFDARSSAGLAYGGDGRLFVPEGARVQSLNTPLQSRSLNQTYGGQGLNTPMGMPR